MLGKEPFFIGMRQVTFTPLDFHSRTYSILVSPYFIVLNLG